MGTSTFFAALRRYLADHRWGLVHTRTLLDALDALRRHLAEALVRIGVDEELAEVGVEGDRAVAVLVDERDRRVPLGREFDAVVLFGMNNGILPNQFDQRGAEQLREARRLLVEFVERGASPGEVRKRNRARVDSSRRDWEIKATATSHGSYDRAVAWPMTAADVVAGGPDHYCDKVRAWAKSINETLKAMP